MSTDARASAFPAAGQDARVVSLVPSITELLFALGLDAEIVGRTRYCVHPRDKVAAVPAVGGTKDVDLERVRALSPSHVIVNVDENLAATADALRAFVPHVVVTHPNAPEDNLPLFRLLGHLFGRGERAEALCASLQDQIDACAGRTWPRERVLYLIWKSPWMTVASDTYVAATLALVGWDVIHGPGGPSGATRYPIVDDLDAAVARSDRILLSTEPYRFREAHARELRARFPESRVDVMDGEMTSWYGPRAIDGLAYLRRLRLAAGSR